MGNRIPITLLLACLPAATRASSKLAFSTLPRRYPSRTLISVPRIPQLSRAWLSTVRASDIFSSSSAHSSTTKHHVVDGVVCREIPIELPVVGIVTVLEATAEAQGTLVDMALALDEDELNGIEQKLAAGDPYGAVLWPAAWAVANYLLTCPDIIRDKSQSTENPLHGLSILELGTGTGLVSIAAALGGAKVLATDYEPLALLLTEYAVRTFHGDNNSRPTPAIETRLLDMCDYATPLPSVDLVVAADIMYEPKTGIAMAHRAVEALRQGSRVLVGDSPGRPGRPAFLKTLKELGVTEATFVDTMGRTCSGPRHELICGKGSTSVSDVPEELPVAIMDLKPSMLSR